MGDDDEFEGGEHASSHVSSNDEIGNKNENNQNLYES